MRPISRGLHHVVRGRVVTRVTSGVSTPIENWFFYRNSWAVTAIGDPFDFDGGTNAPFDPGIRDTVTRRLWPCSWLLRSYGVQFAIEAAALRKDKRYETNQLRGRIWAR